MARSNYCVRISLENSDNKDDVCIFLAILESHVTGGEGRRDWTECGHGLENEQGEGYQQHHMGCRTIEKSSCSQKEKKHKQKSSLFFGQLLKISCNQRYLGHAPGEETRSRFELQ